MTGARRQCSRCGRRFRSEQACQMHIRDKHLKRGGEAVAPPEREPSIADMMLDAELSRAMGEPVPDWLADMLP